MLNELLETPKNLHKRQEGGPMRKEQRNVTGNKQYAKPSAIVIWNEN